MCGIFGVFGDPLAARQVHFGLHKMQARATKYAGIVSSDGRNLFRETGKGVIQTAIDEEMLARLPGKAAIGQIRYATVIDDKTKDNAQPVMDVIGGNQIALVHNGNYPNIEALREKLKEEGRFRSSMDSEVWLRLFCKSKEKNDPARVGDVNSQISGSGNILLLYNDVMIAVRGMWGNRPILLGRREGAWYISSENHAFNVMGIETVRELLPGEILIITKDGLKSYYFDEDRVGDEPISHKQAMCIFELLYYAHPDSTIFGQEVVDFRIRAGRKLCQLCPSSAKKVISVPDSANFHADGYSGESGYKLVLGVLRDHYIGRTFIDPVQKGRKDKVKRKFSPVRSLISNERLTVVDDSIVRLTTMTEFASLLLDMYDVTELHGRISSPPITHPCYHGIDTPTKNELAAATMSIEQIRERSRLETLEFMPLVEGLQTLVPNKDDFCYGCMTGNYPIPLEQRV